MARRNQAYALFGMLTLAAALIPATGCGNKEEAPPASAGYYTGDMKGKTVKPMGDTSGKPGASKGIQ